MLMVLKKQLKRNRKKGFTLVEVIVVLVILAILAAIAIPALTGYIDKANEKALVSEARNATVAMQEYVSEQYGNGTPIISGTSITAASAAAIVNNLAGTNFKDKPTDNSTSISDVTVAGNTVGTFSIQDGASDGSNKVTYNKDKTPQYSSSKVE